MDGFDEYCFVFENIVVVVLYVFEKEFWNWFVWFLICGVMVECLVVVFFGGECFCVVLVKLLLVDFVLYFVMFDELINNFDFDMVD